ncbi:MAG: hypothetical protein Q8M83_04830 [bacterium]|nr:hypothetical protein [bacterium]
MTLIFQSLRLVFLNILGDFFYFPVWWYSLGFLKMAKKAGLSLLERERDLGLDIWLRNIFTPMYGQYDWAGRVISFFMRLAQIVGRTIILLIWLAFLLFFLCVWLAVPVAVVYQIFKMF